jgi:hypothetical protein
MNHSSAYLPGLVLCHACISVGVFVGGWLVSLGDVERMCVVLMSVRKPACSVRIMIDYQKGNVVMKIERSHTTLSLTILSFSGPLLPPCQTQGKG